MKPPAGKRLKTADIAEMTGLSEEYVRDIASRNSKRIPSRQMGRIQVYDEKAAAIFTAIAQEEGRGGANPPEHQKKTNKPTMNKKEKAGSVSRLSSISKNREEEEKAAKNAEGGKKHPGRVPNHLINTVAMQGQQFSRFADRLATLENALAANQTESEERIERLERQVAALQEQMEAVDAWIEHVDRKMAEGDARTKELAQETHSWTEYVRSELAYLKLSWWEKRKQK